MIKNIDSVNSYNFIHRIFFILLFISFSKLFSDNITIDNFNIVNLKNETFKMEFNISNSTEVKIGPFIAEIYANNNFIGSIRDIRSIRSKKTEKINREFNYFISGKNKFILNLSSFDGNIFLTSSKEINIIPKINGKIEVNNYSKKIIKDQNSKIFFKLFNSSKINYSNIKINIDLLDGSTKEIKLKEKFYAGQNKIISFDHLYNSSGTYEVSLNFSDKLYGEINKLNIPIYVLKYSSKQCDIRIDNIKFSDIVENNNSVAKIRVSNIGMKNTDKCNADIFILKNKCGSININELKPNETKEFTGKIFFSYSGYQTVEVKIYPLKNEKYILNNKFIKRFFVKSKKNRINISAYPKLNNGIIIKKENELVNFEFSAENKEVQFESNFLGDIEYKNKRTIFVPYNKTYYLNIRAFIKNGNLRQDIDHKKILFKVIYPDNIKCKLLSKKKIVKLKEKINLNVIFNNKNLSKMYNSLIFKLYDQNKVILSTKKSIKSSKNNINTNFIFSSLVKGIHNLFATVKVFSNKYQEIPELTYRSNDIIIDVVKNKIVPSIKEQLQFFDNIKVKFENSDVNTKKEPFFEIKNKEFFSNNKQNINIILKTSNSYLNNSNIEAGIDNNKLKKYKTDILGRAVIYSSMLTEGIHYVDLKYNGNKYYKKVNEKLKINILNKRNKTYLITDDIKIIKGKKFKIPVMIFYNNSNGFHSAVKNGKILCDIKDKELKDQVIKTDDRGLAFLLFKTAKLTKKYYKIRFKFNKNKFYYSSSSVTNINIIDPPIKTELFIDNIIVEKNKKIKWNAQLITVKNGKDIPIKNKKIILFNEEKNNLYSKTRNNGKAYFSIDSSKISEGEHFYTAEFKSHTNKYTSSLCRAMITVLNSKDYNKKMSPDIKINNVYTENRFIYEKTQIVLELENIGMKNIYRFNLKINVNKKNIFNKRLKEKIKPHETLNVKIPYTFSKPNDNTVEVEIINCKNELNLDNNKFKTAIKIEGEKDYGKIFYNYNCPRLNNWIYKKENEILYLKLSGVDFRGNQYEFSLKPLNWRSTFSNFKKVEDNIYEITSLNKEVRIPLVIKAISGNREIYKNIDVKIHETDPFITAQLICEKRSNIIMPLSLDIIFFRKYEINETIMKNIDIIVYYYDIEGNSSKAQKILSKNVKYCSWPNFIGNSKRIRLGEFNLNETGNFRLRADILFRNEKNILKRILSEPIDIEKIEK